MVLINLYNRRYDAQTGADREVQRILVELLNQMDGFDQTTNVKVFKFRELIDLKNRLLWLQIELIL